MAGRSAQREERWTPARVVRLVVSATETALRMLEGETVRLRAMALTYITLFALVPGLVVAFSVVQAFTGAERISLRVHEFLFENLAVGAREEIEPYLERFIDNMHVTSAGLVGGALLVWSAVSLFQNVDRALNDIWGIKRRRPLTQQAVIYWVGLTLGPLLLAGSVMAGAAARSFLAGAGVRFLAGLSEALLTCTFFAVLYVIVPYTKVRVRSAVAGGLIAGLGWELAKWSYTFVVGRFFKYHAIYGSVAAVPIFLLWLFVSWTILLLGARLVFVFQHASVLRNGAPRATSALGREILAGQAMLQIARAFEAGEPALDPDEVAARIGAQAEEAGDALAALRAGGLLVSLQDGSLVPSRPLDRLSLLDVRRAVTGASPPVSGPAGSLAGIVQGVADQSDERLAKVTFRDLCDGERGRADGGARDASAMADPANARSVGTT